MTALLVLALLQAPVPKKTCPWMTQATADRIVGSSTGLIVTHISCEFAHEADFLRVDVFAPSDPFRSYLSRCKSSPEPVRGIGNEAAICDGVESEQLAIGRLRDEVFVLRLKAPFSPDLLRAKIRTAAEIVSGNLY